MYSVDKFQLAKERTMSAPAEQFKNSETMRSQGAVSCGNIPRDTDQLCGNMTNGRTITNSPGCASLEVEAMTSNMDSHLRKHSHLCSTPIPNASPSEHDAPSVAHNRSRSHTDADVNEGRRCNSAPMERTSSMRSSEEELKAPIIGYEVMEQRAKFTVFQIHVQKNEFESWFIFRRYTDFVRLNDQLKELFPHFRLALPPKRWFGDNFDNDFLEDRVLGLQAFVCNVTLHRDIKVSIPVREFFCLDDPPGPHESLEESRALCESLEETVYNQRREIQERDAKIELLQEEINMQKSEIQQLNKALRIERSLNDRRSSQSSRSNSSLPEERIERLLNDRRSSPTARSYSSVPEERIDRPLNDRQSSPSSQSNSSLPEVDLHETPLAQQANCQNQKTEDTNISDQLEQ